MSGILGLDLERFHRKTAEAENSPLGPRGKKGVCWNMKILSVRKKNLVGWKNKMLIGQKTFRLKKKMSVGEFPLPKWQWKCPYIPWNARPKNGKTPLGPRGKTKIFGWELFFLSVGERNVGWKKNYWKKMSVGEFPLPKWQ